MNKQILVYPIEKNDWPFISIHANKENVKSEHRVFLFMNSIVLI